MDRQQPVIPAEIMPPRRLGLGLIVCTDDAA
jgi:hypothetical protein